MSACTYCNNTGIEPNIGGCCVMCGGSGTRRAGKDPYLPSRAMNLSCLCGWAIPDCPAARKEPCRRPFWMEP